jgi:hypothetical protein
MLRKLVLPAVGALAVAACGGDDGGSGPTPPAAPATVAVQQLSLSSARVSWSKVSGATSYTLSRSTAGGAFAQVASALTDTTYDDTGLTQGVTYSYQVTSTGTGGTSAASNPGTITLGVKAATLTGNITANRTLTADSLYTLSGYVKVQAGATLTIQAGTKIIGDTLVLGSSLWILRGAKIDAQGTAASPIVFTSARSQGNRKPGDWGGIIIIGNGITNRTGSTILTEGAAAGVAENYAGGTDNTDNSGTLRYVRIEFAGYDISNGAGQELNSLSMYVVGSGTTIEYIQTMAGLDDSYEWWGGAVDGRYLVSYESGDDHFDWTEGYQGQNQYLIALQTQRLVPAPSTGTFSGDPRGFEGDGCDPGVSGCTSNATGASTPYSMPVFANFTMIGTGNIAGIPNDGNGAVLRRGTGGTIFNGVLSRWKGTGINIRDAWTDSLFVASGGKDSLNIQGVILAQNAFNLDTTCATACYSNPANWNAPRLATLKQFGPTVLVDTLLGISTNPAGLVWQPKSVSPASTGGQPLPAGRASNFFGGTMASTTYIGAVDPAGGAASLWYNGWTLYQIN